MASRAARKNRISKCIATFAVFVVGTWLLSCASAAFVKPRASTNIELPGPEVAAAGALGVLATALPAEAYDLQGPLTGAEVCTSKPLFYLIAPLCDPVYYSCPIYFFPLCTLFYQTIITIIQLLIPATQPDEALRN